MQVSNEILAILGTVNVFVLGYLGTQIRELANKLDVMVKAELCAERQAKCREEVCRNIEDLTEEQKGLWDAIHKHSHTGLPSDSKVTR